MKRNNKGRVLYPYTYHIESMDNFGWCHQQNQLMVSRWDNKTNDIKTYYFRNPWHYRLIEWIIEQYWRIRNELETHQ